MTKSPPREALLSDYGTPEMSVDTPVRELAQYAANHESRAVRRRARTLMAKTITPVEVDALIDAAHSGAA